MEGESVKEIKPEENKNQMELENQDGLEEKQNFLRKEIMEKGYNTDKFVEHLILKKGENGANIEIWNLEELQKIVSDFQKFSQPEVEVDLNLNNRRAQSIISRQSNNSSATHSHQRPSTLKSFFDDYTEIITCVKQGKTPLLDYNNLNISLTDPEKHEGGLFSHAYYSFLITVPEINSKVRRRFSDFLWLRENLIEFYPGHFIPPIPKKKLIEKMSGQDLAYYRMRQLEKFLDSMLKSRVVRSSQIVYDFLTIENLKEFNSVKDNYSKCTGPIYVKDYSNIDGIIEVKINPELDITAQQIIHQCESSETVLRKLNKQFKTLTTHMENVSLTLNEISHSFQELEEINNIYKIPNEDDMVGRKLKMMSKLTQQWSHSYSKQCDMIDYDLREFFDYIRKEQTAFKRTLIEEYTHNRTDYVNHHIKLINRKEELFKQGNVAKWDLPQEMMEIMDCNELLKNKELAFTKMLVKETQQVNSLRRNFGFHLDSVNNEYARIIKIYNKRYKNHFLNLSNKNTDLLADSFSLVKLLTCSV